MPIPPRSKNLPTTGPAAAPAPGGRNRWHPRGGVVLLWPIAFALLSWGCASNELRAYEIAQADLEQCQAENANEPSRCDVLEDAARRRYDEYEESARTRWGGPGGWRDREGHLGRE